MVTEYWADLNLPSGMVWGWIIAMVFIQCVALSLAELCSSMPTRSELYSQSIVLHTLTFFYAAVVSITRLLFLHPQDGALLHLGRLAGPVGLDKSQVHHRSTIQ
jgi:hypothetical protein